MQIDKQCSDVKLEVSIKRVKGEYCVRIVAGDGTWESTIDIVAHDAISARSMCDRINSAIYKYAKHQ